MAIENNSNTKKESYTHLLSRQSKMFGVPMKNIEMSLTGHRNLPWFIVVTFWRPRQELTRKLVGDISVCCVVIDRLAAQDVRSRKS